MIPDITKGPVFMGIVNVTPDSFSDGGHYLDAQAAIDHGLRLIEEGAQIIDIGGESTRPGAKAVSEEEEQARIIPVIQALSNAGALISVDTRHAGTMKAAVEAGAGMINDVSALQGEGSLAMAASLSVPVCLMHMQGEPQSMQKAPHYEDAVQDVFDFLAGRIARCVEAGIAQNSIIADPGIGFGKTLSHNVDILKNLQYYSKLGVPVLLGTSRKSFIEKIHPGAKADQRLPGSLASIVWGYAQGVRMFRVHDVGESVQALTVYSAIVDGLDDGEGLRQFA